MGLQLEAEKGWSTMTYKITVMLLLLVVCNVNAEEVMIDGRLVKFGPPKTSVIKATSGRVIIVLKKAIELQQEEVKVGLEKYEVRVLEDDKFYYVLFWDPLKPKGMIGSRKEVPQYEVIADKETLEVIAHYVAK